MTDRFGAEPTTMAWVVANRQDLVGRQSALDQLNRLLQGTRLGEGRVLIVSGSAGMGKTSVLRTALLAESELVLGWGTCVDGGAAPGFWPWTQALNGVVRAVGIEAARHAAGADLGLVATVVPALGASVGAESSSRGRMLMLDAMLAWLQTLAQDRAVVVVLDDLQWVDESSLELLELAASAGPSRVSVIGAYRHDELAGHLGGRLVTVTSRAEHVKLAALDDGAAAELARSLSGGSLGDPGVAALLRRAGGHPLFIRELALAVASDSSAEVPSAVREAIDRRVRRLTPQTVEVLQVAAVAGPTLLPDVVAAGSGCSTAQVERVVAEATSAGLLSSQDGIRFGHDLYREVLATAVTPADRPAMHRAVGRALAARAERLGDVPASEVALHLRIGIGAEGSSGAEEAMTWALRAAQAERQSLALAEAAEHLRLLRAALADAELTLPARELVKALLVEADLLARDGRGPQARDVLEQARVSAREVMDATASAEVALAAVGLGSRFASRRDEVISELRGALTDLPLPEKALRARVGAALARELAHSIAEERARAHELAEEALALGRTTGDPDVLADCLLARHDILWTPGSAHERAEVTVELVGLARHSGDVERLAQMLLLHANVLVETGRASFVTTLDECLSHFEQLGQLRHRYTVVTRQAFRALLHGQLDEAESLINSAVELGERIGEPDTGNVRMSQRLELVRARGVPAELVAFAAEAVGHWTGAPVHAHAVAAGFSARAGDLDVARHHVAAVQDLGGWRAEQSYLWSVFVRELAVAAVALRDRELSEELLVAVEPLDDSCGVNGALVAFAGSHAHTAGRLAFSLGYVDRAESLLTRACKVYERLGAWMRSEASSDLDMVRSRAAAVTAPLLRRRGHDWEVIFAGQTARVRDCKGMHDIATLLRRPGTDVHVLELVGIAVREPSDAPILDRSAAEHYRRRIAELADRRHEAALLEDQKLLASIDEEHDAIEAELRAGTGLGGRHRRFANAPAERARKAVAGRIGDAIRRLGVVLPEAAAHLDQNLVTGVRCRYRGAEHWQVEE